MTSIDTILTTSGNSVAIRLPKEVLCMSGLNGKSNVKISTKKNQIIITKSNNPREGWEEQIDALLATEGDPAKEFADMCVADNDGLHDLPWDGPICKEWQKKNAKLS